jgi:hypothetical protein
MMLSKAEITRLLVQVTSVDGRVVHDGTVEMWWKVLTEIREGDRPWDFDEASRAVVRWFAENEGFMSPRALIAQMRKAREDAALVRHHDSLNEEDWRSDPEPMCRPHGTLITKCMECCVTLSKRAKMFPREDLHSWAVANLYVDEKVPF